MFQLFHWTGGNGTRGFFENTFILNKSPGSEWAGTNQWNLQDLRHPHSDLLVGMLNLQKEDLSPALRRILWNHNCITRIMLFVFFIYSTKNIRKSLSGTEFHSRTKSSDKVDGMGWCKGFSCKPCTPKYLKSLIPLESAGCICFQITWDLSNFVDDILGCGKFTNPPLKKSR